VGAAEVNSGELPFVVSGEKTSFSSSTETQGDYLIVNRNHDLPITAESVAKVSNLPGIESSSTILSTDSRRLLVFDHMDEEITTGELYIAEIKSAIDLGLDIYAPVVVTPSSIYPIRTSPSTVRIDDIDWLYYVEGTGLRQVSIAKRAKVVDNKLVEVTTLELKESFEVMGWPLWYSLPDGRVALAYRNADFELKVAFSLDGIRFEAPVEIGSTGSMPALASFADGTLVFTYQVGPMHRKTALARISRDGGRTWWQEIPVTRSSKNVHDTAPFNRMDGKIDLYYIYPPEGWHGFALWRRCMDRDGRLGNEEQVVATEFGNLLKPSIHRLDKNLLLLTFAEQRSGHNLHAAIINADSQCIAPQSQD
jgi:hypothetical protein